MNWVTTVIGLVESSLKLDPGPKKFSLPMRYGLRSQPSLSHTPLKRSPEMLSPHSVPSHRCCPSVVQPCVVICVEILFASQMSSSAQHVPYLPTPALGSVLDEFQPMMFAS